MYIALKLTIGVLAALLIITAILSYNTNQTDDAYINSLIDELEAKIPQRDSINTNVSQVPVAWHLDHMLKAINGVYNQLEPSDPGAYQSSFNVARLVILGSGIIPRGKGKAPNGTRPPEVINTDDLYAQLSVVRENLNKIDRLDENSHFAHKVFGNLNRQKAKRLIQVHTNHHLKIVRDILEK